MLAQLDNLIKDSQASARPSGPRLRSVISTKPGLNRYLRITPAGLLRTDAAKIKAEKNLDGKVPAALLRPNLPAEDIALGYKQLAEVETSKPQCSHSRAGWQSLRGPSCSVSMRAA